jgi:hypothetical protein
MDMTRVHQGVETFIKRANLNPEQAAWVRLAKMDPFVLDQLLVKQANGLTEGIEESVPAIENAITKSVPQEAGTLSRVGAEADEAANAAGSSAHIPNAPAASPTSGWQSAGYHTGNAARAAAAAAQAAASRVRGAAGVAGSAAQTAAGTASNAATNASNWAKGVYSQVPGFASRMMGGLRDTGSALGYVGSALGHGTTATAKFGGGMLGLTPGNSVTTGLRYMANVGLPSGIQAAYGHYAPHWAGGHTAASGAAPAAGAQPANGGSGLSNNTAALMGLGALGVGGAYMMGQRRDDKSKNEQRGQMA